MTAGNFESSVLPFTLRYEGGKVDDPRDPGGRTNKGVTQRTFTAWLAKSGKPSRDVCTITDPELQAIYRSSYWNAVKGDDLPDGADLVLFDYGVNSGPARALAAYAKRTSNDAATIVTAVTNSRLSFLHALGTFKTFGKGWTARVAACEALGLKMAEHARIGVPVTAPATAGTATKLIVEGRAAAAKAKGHKQKAVGALTAAAAGALTLGPGAPAAVQVPTAVIAFGAAGALGLVALLAWRARQQGARADALALVGQESAAPPPTLRATATEGLGS